MKHDLPPIYIIHPVTEDLRFLNRLIKQLRKAFPGRVRYIKLSASEGSHHSAFTFLSEIKNSLLIFLCHGYSDCILGCDFGGSDFNLAGRFEYGPFLTKENVGRLAGNSIFAFCCYSNGLAEAAVNAGAVTAMGFESIRFDYKHNVEKGRYFGKIRQRAKFEVRAFLFESLAYALNNNLTWLAFQKHVRLVLNKRHKQILASEHKHKSEIAAILLEIKSGMKLFGKENSHLFT